ncbi:hypothetical protein EDB80DRAFT_817436 [Ilyonectria destructans]|nr:hypothetical protein EDB80DRAFT_817436 [Ilyonectria destructans]
MDHLPQLKNRSGFRVEVRFLEDARFAYDGKGLEGFPGRCNFTFAKPHDLQTCWESSKFFQSWLFFGTLVEIFKVYNILILSDDFIISASYKYPGILNRSEHHSTAREVGDIIGSIAGHAVAPLIRLARRDTTPKPTVIDRGQKKGKKEGGKYLIAAFFIYRAIPLDAPFTFTVPFSILPAQLSPQFFLENGWYPREVKIISDLVESDYCALLLYAQLDRHNNLNHRDCNAGKCEAYKVNPKTYRTQHH